MPLNQWEVPPKKLKAHFNANHFSFKTTAELAPLEEIIGQERAVRAMDFGLHMEDRGYNIFVTGVPGTGKNTMVKSMVKRVAETQAVPDDWCYVNNFEDPDHPKAISLDAGKGKIFQRDIDHLITRLKEEFPKAFQSKDREEQEKTIQKEYGQARDSLGEDLETHARELGFAIKSTDTGITIIPLHNGKTMSANKVAALDPQSKSEIQRKELILHEHVHRFVKQTRILREELDQKIETLNQSVAQYTSEHLFETLREKYKSIPRLAEHVLNVQEDVIENFNDFLPAPESPFQIAGLTNGQERASSVPYAVNVLVDNSATKGAPLIEETNPSYNNLVGRIEKKGRFGTFYTDFTLIKSGSILNANGGYLLINAFDLLRAPYSWDALKRIIKKREVKIEDLGETYGLVTTSGIKPEPIPIHLRVILVGNAPLYYLLQTYDEEFTEIFKVKVDFEEQQKKKGETPEQFARYIARLCKKEDLLHFDRTGVAATLEQLSRWANNQKKLSLRFGNLADLIREASYWALKSNVGTVSREFVQKAVSEKINRSNLLEDHIQELIEEGTLMVDVTGSVVGQINGLSVFDLGDFSFGRPSRLTARVFLGQSGIIDIEREAKMGGKTHSKGVLILSGYLGGRYAQETLLSLSASICFEQSYGGVEGDSASVAELLILLSSLSNLPIRQGIAVTGSVNQLGNVQPVGGINEKIEGFFAVCKALGFTSDQGVVIPQENVKHLMLKDEVLEAVSAKKFQIYSVSTVDDAIEIVTGTPAGECQLDGTYPDGTVNSLVLKRLQDMGEKLRALESSHENKPSIITNKANA